MHKELSNKRSRADLDAVLADYMRRLDASEPVDQMEFLVDHPQWTNEFRAYFSQARAMNRFAAGVTATLPWRCHSLGYGDAFYDSRRQR